MDIVRLTCGIKSLAVSDRYCCYAVVELALNALCNEGRNSRNVQVGHLGTLGHLFRSTPLCVCARAISVNTMKCPQVSSVQPKCPLEAFLAFFSGPEVRLCVQVCSRALDAASSVVVSLFNCT